MSLTMSTADSTIRALGGEALFGADGDGAVGTLAMHFIVPALPQSGRALLVGPHDPALAEQFAARGFAVELLLRRVEDAHVAAGRLAHSGVVVHCGDPARLNGAYDVVVALDGLGRIAGPDSELTTWESILDRLTSLVAPAGVLCALVANRLTDTDADPAAAGYPALSRRLTGAGLHIEGALAVYPSVHTPSLIAHRDAFDPGDDTVATLVARSYNSLAGDDTTVVDPRRQARQLVHDGLGFSLAPAWMLVATRPTPERQTGARPPVAIAVDDRPGLPYWSAPQILERDDAGVWRRRLAYQPDAGARGLGHLTRTPEALIGGAPTGPLLEELMVGACDRHDMRELRQLLTRYHDWMSAAHDRLFGHPDNVVATCDGDLKVFDSSWSTLLPVRPEIALLCSLRRFADRLLSTSSAHPWPAGTSPDRIAVRLAAMAGVVATEADLREATSVAADLTGPLHQAADEDPQASRAAIAWLYNRGIDGRPRGYVQAITALESHKVELAAAQEQLRWLAEEVADRDTRLSATGRELSTLRRSLTYRAGYALLSPAHVARRLVRRLTRPMRSKGATK